MSDEVKLEEEWVAKKQAIQTAAREAPPKKTHTKLLATLAGIVVLIAGIVAVLVIAGLKDAKDKQAPDSIESVRIEVRSYPAMELTMDGKKLGRTPRSILVPKSDKAIKLDVEYVLHYLGREEMRTDSRMVVPDRDLTVDFTQKRGDDARPPRPEP